jgi:aminopeptidase N
MPKQPQRLEANDALLRWARTLALALCWATTPLCALAQTVSAPSVRHYEVQLRPDLVARSLVGTVKLHLRIQPNEPPQWALDAGAGLVIDRVSERGQALRFERKPEQLLIDAAPRSPAGPSATGTERVLEIEFHGTPQRGMRFLPQREQVYTAFSTSQWMPCVDAPAERATLLMSLDLPSGLKVVANGNWVRTEALAEGFSRSVWQQDGAIPSYLFGFAAGRFREVIDTTATPNLHFLGPEEFSEQQLRQIFQDTRSMLTFYADKAGLPYPGSRYTQVLVGEAQAQEAAGFALLSEAYGRRLLADPQQAWLVAHEVSHQWWGNGVTNRAWTHFWLNEGLASFMNAAWFEHRYGREAYLLHMDGALAKYERVRAAAADKPLHFPAWQSPTAMDRSLVYDKGATLVRRLRETMGEADFWRGIQAYTQRFWGQAVRSADFQAAMQSATSKDLAPWFTRWVNAPSSSPISPVTLVPPITP